jgi:hypothetical protein
MAGLVVLPLCLGCGVKGPPKVPRETSPEAIFALAHRMEDGRLILTWTSPDEGQAAPTYFLVYRAMTALTGAGTACKNCPPSFEAVAKVPHALDGKHSYQEELASGFHYYYKIVTILSGGREGVVSQTVEFVN